MPVCYEFILTGESSGFAGGVLIAVAGLLLVGINIVVAKTVFKHVRRNAGARPSAKLRVVLDFKNIKVGSATVKQYEALAAGDVLTQGFVGNSRFFSALGQISTYRNIDRGWVVGKDHAGSMQSFMWMPDAEIAHSWLVVFVQNARKYVYHKAFGWRFSAIDYLSNCRDRGAVHWKGIWERHADPCALIDAH